MKSIPPADPDLEIGSMVEVMQAPPLYGVIRWIGSLPDQKEPTRPIAGLEMVGFFLFRNVCSKIYFKIVRQIFSINIEKHDLSKPLKQFNTLLTLTSFSWSTDLNLQFNFNTLLTLTSFSWSTDLNLHQVCVIKSVSLLPYYIYLGSPYLVHILIMELEGTISLYIDLVYFFFNI
jgi:hypothetical protein